MTEKGKVTCITDLPVEIIIKITEYLDPETVVCLQLVSKLFCKILLSDSVWKGVYMNEMQRRKGRVSLPHLDALGLNDGTPKLFTAMGGVDWKKVSLSYDREQRMWGGDLSLTRIPVSHSTVDALHFVNGNLFACGARTRALSLWSVESESPLVHVENAHSGWIWDIKSYENSSFFSSAWDNAIKHWALREGGIQEISSFMLRHAPVSMRCIRGLVVVGTNIGDLILMDPRVGQNKHMFYNANKGPITGILIRDQEIVSVGERRIISAFDLRSAKFTLRRIVSGFPSSVFTCISSHDNIIYAGNSRGDVDLLNRKDKLSRFMSLSLSGEQSVRRNVTSITASLGSFIATSSDRLVHVVVPSQPHLVLWSAELEAIPVSTDYSDNVLIVGTTNGTVYVVKKNETRPLWKP